MGGGGFRKGYQVLRGISGGFQETHKFEAGFPELQRFSEGFQGTFMGVQKELPRDLPRKFQ